MLVLENVSMHFGGLVVLSDVNMRIDAGELVGLIGPNGAGKTTLFNIITGFQRPTSGRITYLGQEINGVPTHVLAARGLVRTFQGARVFPKLSVHENLRVAHHLTSRHGGDAGDLADSAMRILELDRYADEPAGSLPAGLVRTLGIAMAIATGAKLLMLDEPAAGLSAEEVDHLRTVVQRTHAAGVTICIIEHNLKFLMGTVQRACVLDAGTLIANGTPDEVTRNPRVIQAYLGDSLAEG